MITLDQLLDGPYPGDAEGVWPGMLADLTAAVSIRHQEVTVTDARRFLADAWPSDWEPIVGHHYAFNDLVTCRSIAQRIFAERGLL